MRKLSALVIAGVLLLLVTDRVAWWVARNAIAEEIQNAEGLTQRPEVSIGGFPLLTQVYQGRYRQIDVTLRDVEVDGGLTLDTLAVRLQGVQVAVGDLINRQVSAVALDAATADVVVGYQSLDEVAAANLPDSRAKISFGPGDDGLLAITGSYSAAGNDLRLGVAARLIARNEKLTVALVPGALDAVPRVVRADVQAQLEQAVQLPELPFGFQARSVTVGPDGISVRAETDALVLER